MRRNLCATMSLVLAIPYTAAVAVAAVTPFAAASPVTCAIPKPCAMFTNTNTGSAVEGASASGTGLFGTSSSGVYYNPGVDGESSDPDGEDAGGAFGLNVISTGVAPQYGVIAYGNGIGVAGEENSTGTSVSNSGYGVFGQDSTGTASYNGDFNVGVAGASTVGTGVLAMSNASPTNDVFGYSPVGVYSVVATSPGTALSGAFMYFGESSTAGTYGVDLHNFAANSYALMLTPSDLVSLNYNGASFSVDNNGNGAFSGKVTTSKGTYVRTTGASGTAMMEYGDRSTAPQVEDVGEAQLENGRAYVSIDGRLADTIDRRAAYHVFVTPEGECNGLYVAQKTAAGFVVRELHEGRTSLAFEYRIVAKPRDEDGARLAIAPPLKAPDDDGVKKRPARISRPPLSPQERLKERIGTQAYAKAMLLLRARR